MKQRLLEERDLLLRQKEAIENQIAGLERAITLFGDDGEILHAATNGKRTATKGIVLDLLRDVGTTGLNAATAVNLANMRGFTLVRNSVSSLLSRLKADEVITYDGEKYRLKEFSCTRQEKPKIY